ncbi:MAG: gas vesicle protein K [Ignavibacteriota bacterium]|nr:gas vesicle protein K [Ignavibacteriota bacterium]
MEVLTAQLDTLSAITDSRLNVNADNVDSGLAKLVLTLVELIRKLIEKQAMRRVEGGTLTDEEIERLGETLMKLENKMEELKKYFNLSDRDLNINLGPLGDLM